jgi:hypothetical protein
MKILSQQEMSELRNDLAGFGISDERKDDLIRFLDAIVASFINQTFGKSPVQLSLSARANYAFIGAETRANLRLSDISELVDLDNEGAINTTGPTRQLAP